MTSTGAVSHMALALAEARAAAARGEVPVGAVVVSPTGEVLAVAGNRTLELRDPTAHAETLAIRGACAAVAQPIDRIAVVAECRLEAPPDHDIVFNQQDAHRSRRLARREAR